ncbi:MAG: periplasmic heavy metal sensor [Saprospiraceae bacterium]|nr:periplasmic heavy metal sensor [Saprospiraceae bacterium]
MNKVRFLTWAVIALGLLNIALIAGFLLRKHPPRPDEGPRERIIKRLQFDESQAKAYNDLINGHRQAIRQKDDEIAAARQELYALLATNDTSARDSLIARVSALQAQVENIHFNHFNDIKQLCKPDQIANFNALAGELETLFGKNKHPEKK